MGALKSPLTASLSRSSLSGSDGGGSSTAPIHLTCPGGDVPRQGRAIPTPDGGPGSGADRLAPTSRAGRGGEARKRTLRAPFAPAGKQGGKGGGGIALLPAD